MIHALALVGLVLFPLPGWRVLAVALAVAAIGGVGTSVCYYRCLAHRSLRLNPVVKNALIFFTIFNASGAPLGNDGDGAFLISCTDGAKDGACCRLS
jgi:fatty-acid desaturase